MTTETCNDDVYKHGELIGMFDMLKRDAEKMCADLTSASGRLHDWHYFAGRVVIKALPEGWGCEPAGKGGE
jgi:hypothetical protein